MKRPKQKVESVSKQRIRNHYMKFFDIVGKGFTMDEDDELMIDWAEYLIKDLTQTQIPLLPSDEEIKSKISQFSKCSPSTAQLMFYSWLKSRIKGIPKELSKEDLNTMFPFDFKKQFYTVEDRTRILGYYKTIINHFLHLR